MHVCTDNTLVQSFLLNSIHGDRHKTTLVGLVTETCMFCPFSDITALNAANGDCLKVGVCNTVLKILCSCSIIFWCPVLLVAFGTFLRILIDEVYPFGIWFDAIWICGEFDTCRGKFMSKSCILRLSCSLSLLLRRRDADLLIRLEVLKVTLFIIFETKLADFDWCFSFFVIFRRLRSWFSWFSFTLVCCCLWNSDIFEASRPFFADLPLKDVLFFDMPP